MQNKPSFAAQNGDDKTPRKRMKPATLHEEIAKAIVPATQNPESSPLINQHMFSDVDLSQTTFNVSSVSNKILVNSMDIIFWASKENDYDNNPRNASNELFYLVDYDWLSELKAFLHSSQNLKNPSGKSNRESGSFDSSTLAIESLKQILTCETVSIIHSLLSNGITESIRLGMVHGNIWNSLANVFILPDFTFKQQASVLMIENTYSIHFGDLEIIFRQQENGQHSEANKIESIKTSWLSLLDYYSNNNDFNSEPVASYEESNLSLLHQSLTNCLEFEDTKMPIYELKNSANLAESEISNNLSRFSDKAENLKTNSMYYKSKGALAHSDELTKELRQKLTVTANVNQTQFNNSNNHDSPYLGKTSYSESITSIHMSEHFSTNNSSTPKVLSQKSYNFHSGDRTPVSNVSAEPNFNNSSSQVELAASSDGTDSQESQDHDFMSINLTNLLGESQFDNSALPQPKLIQNVYQPKPKTVTPGLCGLNNLGNTCYMNSALQCLSNTWELTDYFLSRVFLIQINKKNPLGMNGMFAEEYGILLEHLWNGQNESYAPRSFKSIIGRFLHQFSGYQQQDAPEFLSLFLDGLHEDLNTIIEKPYIELQDSESRPDLEVADEQWDAYKKRNDSVIVDLFQGQLRSSLTCPRCGRNSATFDPFMYMTLLLPVDHSFNINVLFVPADSSSRPTQIGITLDDRDSILQLKRIISHSAQVDTDRILFTETFIGRIYKIFEETELVQSLDSSSTYTAFELGLETSVRPSSDEAVVQILFTEESEILSNNLNSAFNSYKSPNLFGNPILLCFKQTQDTRNEGTGTSISVKLGTIYQQLAEKLCQWVNPKCVGFLKFFAGAIEKVTQADSNKSASLNEKTTENILIKRILSASIDLISLSISRVDSLSPTSFRFPGVGRTLAEIGHVLSSPAIVSGPNSSNAFRPKLDQRQMFKSFEKKAIYKNLEPLPPQKPQEIAGKIEAQNIVEAQIIQNLPTVVNNETLETHPDQVGETDKETITDANINQFDRINSFVSLNTGDTILCTLRMDVLETVLEEFQKEDDSLTKIDEFFQWDKHPIFNISMFSTRNESEPGLKPSLGFKQNLQLQKISDLPLIERVSIKDFDSWAGLCSNRNDSTQTDKEQESSHVLSLYDCLVDFIKEEQLSEQDSWYCSRCKEFSQATKKLDLWRLPEILIIHLKRFDHSREWGKKLNTFVEFPLEGLDLNFLVSKNKYSAEESGENPSPPFKSTIYDLYATSNHYGGYGGGHYTASVLHSGTNKWYNYNDSNVTFISDPAKEVVTESAYVLFYRMRPPASTKTNTDIHMNENVSFPTDESLLTELSPFTKLLEKNTPASIKIYDIIKSYFITKKLQQIEPNHNSVDLELNKEINEDTGFAENSKKVSTLALSNHDANLKGDDILVTQTTNDGSKPIDPNNELYQTIFQVDLLNSDSVIMDEEMHEASPKNKTTTAQNLKHTLSRENSSNNISKLDNIDDSGIPDVFPLEREKIVQISTDLAVSKSIDCSKHIDHDKTSNESKAVPSTPTLKISTDEISFGDLPESDGAQLLPVEQGNIFRTVQGKLMRSPTYIPTSNLPHCTPLSPTQLFRSKSTSSKIYQMGLNVFMDGDPTHLNFEATPRKKKKNIP